MPRLSRSYRRSNRHKDIDTLIRTYVHKTEGELKQAYDKAFNNNKPKPTKPDQDITPKPIEPKITPPQETAPNQFEPSKDQLKNQLLQRLARGEISQDVYLIAIKQLEDTKSEELNYYG